MYRLIPDNAIYGPAQGVTRVDDNTYVPYAIDNSDYQNFKTQINDETAQLETADGVLMTPEEAKAYVATLP